MACLTQPLSPAAERLVADHLGLAEDIARQVFARPSRRQWLDEALGVAADALTRAARRYRPPVGPFGAWVAREVGEKLRRLLHRLTRRAAARPATGPLVEEPAARPHPRPTELPPELLAALTAGQAEVLRLRFELDLPFAAIAAQLGRSKAVVHRRYRRGLEAARRAIRP